MKLNTIAVVVVLTVSILGLLGLNTACAKKEQAEAAKITELSILDKVEGTGVEAKKGDTVKVHYTGKLYPSGRKFDSSLDRNEPFSFKLGAHRVIQGWDEGVAGMKVGGVRVLTIPPSKAYGQDGVPGVIPPDATLQFVVELLGVK